MSNYSSGSSGVSIGCGLPKICRCGAMVVTRMSPSDVNPHRRFMRCGYAFAHRLEGDKFHLFQWEDETVANEVDKMAKEMKELQDHQSLASEKIESELNKVMREVKKVEREMKEKLECEVRKVDHEMKEKLECEVKMLECEMNKKIEDAKLSMKCAIVGAVVVALVSVGLSKLV